MCLVRLASAAYWALLTVLLLAPNPLALLGIHRPPGPSGGRGVHFVCFTLLAVLVHAGRWPVRRRLLVGLLLVYAVVIEGLQWFVPARSVELLDVIENLLGLAVGTAIWWIAQRRTGEDRRS